MLEGLLLQTLLVPHDAGQQAHHGVDQNQGRRLTTRQKVVTDADFFQATGLDHPLVKPLVAAAQQRDTRLRSQGPHARLVQEAPPRAQVDHRTGSVFDRGQGGVDHIRPHHHAGAPAKGLVVDGAVFIARKVPDVQNIERPIPSRQCPAGQA